MPGGWEELWDFLKEEEEERLGISLKGDVWQQEWRPASSERLGGATGRTSPFSALARAWSDGQRVEIAPAVRSLFHSLKSSSSLLPGSSLLLLDYGDTIDRLYDRRPNGTVRGYAHHVRLQGPELYPWGGRADVTADVNFTDVAAWAAEAGLAAGPLETQGAFLEKHGRGLAARAAAEPALAFLLDPRGAGTGFKALELRKT